MLVNVQLLFLGGLLVRILENVVLFLLKYQVCLLLEMIGYLEGRSKADILGQIKSVCSSKVSLMKNRGQHVVYVKDRVYYVPFQTYRPWHHHVHCSTMHGPKTVWA